MESTDDSIGRFDRILCVSVIEHMSRTAALATMRRINEVLLPGGICVLTIDLFLDLHPFTEALENSVGTNMDVRELVEASEMEIIFGYRDELLGYQQFNPDTVTGKIQDLLTGEIPVVAQLLMLRKPA
jgi:hypothetical protein